MKSRLEFLINGQKDWFTIVASNKENLGQGKGAIYESIVFDALNKAGIDTFYFAKSTGLKILNINWPFLELAAIKYCPLFISHFPFFIPFYQFVLNQI